MMKRRLLIFALIALHLFTGFGALSGGAMLVLEPDGSLLGMQPAWLDGSPFKSYLIPGVILFVMIGCVSILTSIGLLFKPSWKFAEKLNLYPSMHWAWTWSLYLSVTLMIWIIVQQIMASFFWLQPVMLATGLLIMVISLLPGTQHQYLKSEGTQQK
jgi:hypothetical protein